MILNESYDRHSHEHNLSICIEKHPQMTICGFIAQS